MGDYEKELQDRENQLKVEEMKRALEETKKIAGAYKGSRRDYVREDENGEVVMVTEPDEFEDQDGEDNLEAYDVAELVTDNQILLNRVDQLLDGGDDSLSTRRSIEQSGDVESLTESLIDGLFKQIKTQDAKQKKNGGYKQKKGTNYVSGKKQVVTFEKTYSPTKQKRPTTATKSRLFEYEKTHQVKNQKQKQSARTNIGNSSKSVSWAE